MAMHIVNANSIGNAQNIILVLSLQ